MLGHPQRYGKLDGNKLTYYTDMSDGAEEKGSLTLGAKSSVKMVDHLHRNRHCFLITGEDGELMAHGETGRDTEKWLVFLRAHIRKVRRVDCRRCLAFALASPHGSQGGERHPHRPSTTPSTRSRRHMEVVHLRAVTLL